MTTRTHLRNSELFLVRVRTKQASSAEDSSDSGGLKAYGTVQRVVDGELHRFDGWQSLVDLLLAMLIEKKGRQLR